MINYRRAAAVASALAWVALALVPAAARAEEAPSVSSLSAHEAGSAGGTLVTITGTNFTGAITPGGVKFGTVPLKKVSGTLSKATFKVIGETQIQVDLPYHERGRIAVTVTNSAGSSGSETVPTADDEFTFWPELYKNEGATATSTRVQSVGFGVAAFSPTQSANSVVECTQLGFGVGLNEGSPTTAHGEVFTWWASGHNPSQEHTETSGRCRFVDQGVNENQPTSPEAWVTAETPLQKIEQQGVVCRDKALDALEKCPETSEREETTVVERLRRDALTLPWALQFTEREGKPRVWIGLPQECKGLTGTERTELSRCPQSTERESAKTPERCVISAPSEGPAPQGCVRLQVITTPPLNYELRYEGYVEPATSNGIGNGISPSSWEFEGRGREECLRLRISPGTLGCVTGTLKLLGYNGQELLTIK
jgi:hypothetical protein